ncbi:MAG: response regulator [Proteobacteria bacterium]|nr:response regulator [Pseudomonadota bacterium]MBU1594147.1 response regulator [Pseudomonadota bacterium]
MNAVLLVDDERDFADLLAERLQARGFAVRTAYDAEEALRLAAGHDLDVAVLDVNLPGMNGLDLLRELKLLRPQAEALMLTGQNDLATAVLGMKLGATDYLVKPVPIEGLVEAIGRALDRRQTRLEGVRMAETAKMAALGQMAEGVAHEINNPVNVMVSLAGWMGDLVADLGDQAKGRPGDKTSGTLTELAQSAAKLHEQGQRVKRTTAKLLCLCHKARLDGSARPKAAAGFTAKVDLEALVQALLAERTGRMRRRGVSAELDIPPDLPGLILPAQDLPGADLGLALGNILDNALDAMPSGGRLSVRASALDHELRIEIEDTGQGISPAHLPRVFEPFFSTKEVGQGAGLGLSVSYGTVKSLGGDILINSPPGQGAQVLVTLPC